MRAGVRVSPVARADDGFRLTGDDGADLGTFDRVAVTAPAPQAAELLAAAAPDLAERAAAVTYDPCWAVLAAWDAPLPITPSWRRADAPDAPVLWAARESAKPGRDPGERWTIQGGPRLEPRPPGGRPGRRRGGAPGRASRRTWAAIRCRPRPSSPRTAGGTRA